MNFKKIFFLFAFSSAVMCVLPAQEEIKIFINGEKINISNESIRVKEPDDFIEFKIFTPKVRVEDLNQIVEKIEFTGCNFKELEKKGIFTNSSDLEEQVQSTQSTKTVEKKYKFSDSIEPIFNSDYISFQTYVYEITSCRGKRFYFSIKFNPDISNLEDYKGFLKSYKFYYVK